MSTSKFTQELKQKWLDALRSGKYKQGRKALHSDKYEDGDRYCCLGVLCKVADIPLKDSQQIQAYTILASLLDTGQTKTDKLINMNDGDEYTLPPRAPSSFAEIADWIEDNMPAHD